MEVTKRNLSIPFITTGQMREVDRLMTEDYGIDLIQMMENAGRCLGHLARLRFLDNDPTGKRVLVLAGRGGNGGGGMVCARRLHNWGAQVQVWIAAPPAELRNVPGRQHAILRRLDIKVVFDEEVAELPLGDLIIDAIIGYSIRGAPEGASKYLIQAANRHGAAVLALDVPSGVDPSTGEAHDPSINAAATMTLALPKKGFENAEAGSRLGELYLADIGVPPNLYRHKTLGLEVGNIFAQEDIVRIW